MKRQFSPALLKLILFHQSFSFYQNQFSKSQISKGVLSALAQYYRYEVVFLMAALISLDQRSAAIAKYELRYLAQYCPTHLNAAQMQTKIIQKYNYKIKNKFRRQT